LAVTGRGNILKKFPLNPGIDLAGVVESSNDPNFKTGDKVLVNGCGLGETQDGGFAEKARVPGNWIVPLPTGLSLFEAMQFGTAGFTAALALHRMEQNGQTPKMGPIVVTGATGGVGSFAVRLLLSRGYEVIALTGREAMKDYLTKLGSQKVSTSEDFELGELPLNSVKCGGVIDSVGGDLLAKLFASVNLWGNVACIGLAQSPKLEATVFPLILRGVSLLGISSANCPQPLREQIWNALGGSQKSFVIEPIEFETFPLSQVIEAASLLLDRKKQGRVVVDCRGEN